MNTSKKIIKRVENDLKPHNVETIKNILEIYKTSNKCCAIQATGTGKTFLTLRLLEIYNDEGKSAVIFAPNREIIKQTKKRMKWFGLSNAIFYTYQKLAKMTYEEIADIKADFIVCDELHRIGAKTWGQKFEMLVETHPDSKVFGVTATPLRCTDGRDMAEEYFDGNKACDISLAEALVREIIPVMPLYVSGLFTFEEEYENMLEKIKKSNNSNEEKTELKKVLLVAKQQMEKAKGVSQIIKKYITNYNGKYIVFCKDKKHLYAMKNVVVSWFREAGYTGEIFEYPYYSNNSEVKKNLNNFEVNREEGLKLLFVIDKLNEGLHLDEVQGCILLRTTTSNIIYYQQIGRAIDAGSNKQRVILDLVSNFNSLKSFNFKKELENKIIERREGKFSECSEEFEIDKFDVIDLVQECVDVFNEIDNKINVWSVMYKRLKEFYQNNGHCIVPTNYEDISLYHWVKNVRIKYINNKLSNLQVKELDNINFAFNYYEWVWNKNFIKLKEYFKNYNTNTVPSSYISDDGTQLGAWFTRQGKLWRAGELTLDKEFLLKQIGANLYGKDKIWMDRFEDYKSYIKEYETPIVKPQFKKLYIWYKNNRTYFNNGKLESWKIELLEKYGFIFKQEDYEWDRKICELQKYINEYGDANVTKQNKEYSALYAWMVKQKRAWKDGILSETKQKVLEGLGVRCMGNREFNHKETQKKIRNAIENSTIPTKEIAKNMGISVSRFYAYKKEVFR